MVSKRVIMPVAVILTTALVVTLLPRASGELVEPAPTSTPLATEPDRDPTQESANQVPAAVQTGTPTIPMATEERGEHTTVSCLQPEPLIKPINDRPLVRTTAGSLVTLDGRTLFDLPDDAVGYQWSQVFADQDSLDYTTHTAVPHLLASGATASFRPETPGKYRLRLTTAASADVETVNEVEVLVPAPADRFDFRSINFPDLFGNNGGDTFIVNPEDPECRKQVLDHAFSMAERVNANWVTIVPAQGMTQLFPTPKWGEIEETLALTDDVFYGDLIEAAHAHGLKVLQAEQDGPALSLGEVDHVKWQEARNTPEYWVAWFEEWTPWAVARAARAEKYGVEMFSPFVWANELLEPWKNPTYEQDWRDLIAAIREVYSGEIAIWSIGNVTPTLNFLDDLDAVILSLDSNGLYGEGFIDDTDNPQLDQVINSVKGRLDQSRPTLGDSGVPVYYSPIASSSNGQKGSEDVEELATFVPDFQEQAIFYEGMLHAFVSEPWITGIMLSVTDWFDQFGRPPEGLYFDQTFQASPRSKPAEDVSALWFGVD